MGLRDEEMARVRIEGGRFDGLCVQIRNGETLDEAVERLRAATIGGGPSQ